MKPVLERANRPARPSASRVHGKDVQIATRLRHSTGTFNVMIERRAYGSPTKQCARFGCSARAVATFTFDSATCTVWLDSPLVGNARAGELCARHARSLTPPRGWTVEDRRGTAPAAAVPAAAESLSLIEAPPSTDAPAEAEPARVRRSAGTSAGREPSAGRGPGVPRARGRAAWSPGRARSPFVEGFSQLRYRLTRYSAVRLGNRRPPAVDRTSSSALRERKLDTVKGLRVRGGVQVRGTTSRS